MAIPNSDRVVVPDEKTPRRYGLLNVVFASVLLLLNVGMAGFYVLAPALAAGLDRWQAGQNAEMMARHRAGIEEWKKKEAEAPTEAERAAAKQEVARLESSPAPQMPSMTIGMKSMSDPRVVAYGVTEVATGLILNVLMLVGGVGLLGLREWGRKMAVAVAALKLVRLALLVAVCLALIVPIQVAAISKELGQQMEQLNAAQAKAGAAGFFLSPQWISAQSTGGVVLNAIAASVYPILVLVMLNKARVKAACDGSAKPAPRETWT